MHKKKILIIIPAYNEGKNIKRTVDEVLALELPVDVLVVDDGSNDATAAEAARTKAELISLPFNLGIGGAVQTGFKFALRNGYDIAARIDGDGQHDVNYLEKIIGAIIGNRADMIIGSRFIGPSVGYRSSFVRRIGINFFASLISSLTKCKVTDPTSGFTAYNRKGIKFFASYYPHDFPEPEAIVMAKRSGLKVIEVPVQMKKRAAGNSSIRYLRTLYYMIKVTFAILLHMLKRKREVEE